MIRVFLICLAALGVTACASTGGAPAEDAVTSMTPAGEEAITMAHVPEAYSKEWWDEVVCQREPSMGSRLSRNRCHSRFEWSSMQKNASETMRDMELSGIQGIGIRGE